MAFSTTNLYNLGLASMGAATGSCTTNATSIDYILRDYHSNYVAQQGEEMQRAYATRMIGGITVDYGLDRPKKKLSFIDELQEEVNLWLKDVI